MYRSVRKSGIFIWSTLFASWLFAALAYTFGVRWNTPAAMVVGVVYMFIPMIVAIVVQKYVFHNLVRGPLGISFRLNRWFLVAWLLPLGISLATIGVSLVLPGTEFSPCMEGMFERFGATMPPEKLAQAKARLAALPIHPFWLGVIQALLAGATVNAIAGFGEELGWRGFLQREFAFLGFWKSSYAIGLVWGIWHAPLIIQGHNYPQHPAAGVFMMILFCFLTSPLISYIRLKSGSVIAAAVFHGMINATGGLAIIVVRGGSDLLNGVTGVAGLLVLLGLNGLLFLSCRSGPPELEELAVGMRISRPAQ